VQGASIAQPIERSRIERFSLSADRDLLGPPRLPISSGVMELGRRTLRPPVLVGTASAGECRLPRDGLFPASKYPPPGERPNGEGVFTTAYPVVKCGRDDDCDSIAPPMPNVLTGNWIVGAGARPDRTAPAVGGTAVFFGSTSICSARSVRNASFPELWSVARISTPSERMRFPSERVEPVARGPPVLPSAICPRAPLANSWRSKTAVSTTSTLLGISVW
jgi:hypothetical protein